MISLPSAFFAAVNFLYASIFGGPIDGTAWDVKVRQDGFFHWSSRRDMLIFHAGRAVIAGEVARGYAPALYESRPDGEGMLFSVTLDSDGRDPIEWTGVVRGDHVSGAVIVRGRDGRVLRYVFTGARKTG